MKFFDDISQREPLDFPQYHDSEYLFAREFEPFVLEDSRKDNFQYVGNLGKNWSPFFVTKEKPVPMLSPFSFFNEHL